MPHRNFMTGIAVTTAAIIAACALPAATQPAPAKDLVLQDGFDAGSLSAENWSVVPDTSTIPEFDTRGEGKAVHFRSTHGDRGMATRLAVLPPYELSFDFLQPANEAGGYRLVVFHPRPNGNAWWFEYGSTECAVWTTHEDGWAPRWSAGGMKPDTWYHVRVEDRIDGTRFTITEATGAQVAVSDWLAHDDLGEAGNIVFTAASGGGLRGAVFDNIELRTARGSELHRIATSVDPALHRVLDEAPTVAGGSTLTLRTEDGLEVVVDRAGAVRQIEVAGQDRTPTTASEFGGFYAWDITHPAEYHRFLPADAECGPQELALECPALKLALRVQLEPQTDRVNLRADVEDLTRSDRAIVVVFVLPVEGAGWTWGDTLTAARQIGEAGRYHNNMSYGRGGQRGRHQVAQYPWASLTGTDAGLMLARPLDLPRLMGFWYDHTDTRRFLAARVDLGLSPLTRKFPCRASFALCLSCVPRPDWGFRAAARRYYDLYPESFVKRVAREGLWHLWVTPEIKDPEELGLVFQEEEPFLEDRVLFDEAHGGYSFTYSEPSTLWQKCESWDDKQQLNVAGFLEATEARAKAPPTVTTTYPFWTQPQPLSDAEIAQALLNTYVGKEGSLNGWNAYPDRFAVNCNGDPELPRPSRASLWFDHEGVPALTDPRVDGAYLDSVGWHAFDVVENGRREHWATTDVPLIPSFADLKPTQLAGFSHYELYAAIAEAMHSRGKLVLANTFPYSHLFCAHLLDVLGAGEAAELEPFHDAARLGFCRVLAFRKPVSHMNYAYFNPSVPLAEKERALQRDLIYCIWPGSGNVANSEQVDSIRPLFRRYIPVFQALAAAGWEPITEAWVEPAQVLLERYGDPTRGPVHLVAHNPTGQAVSARIRIGEGLGGIAGAGNATDLVSGMTYSVTDRSIAVELAGWQTVALRLVPAGEGQR